MFKTGSRHSGLATKHVIWSADTASASYPMRICTSSLEFNGFKPVGFASDLDRKLRQVAELFATKSRKRTLVVRLWSK